MSGYDKAATLAKREELRARYDATESEVEKRLIGAAMSATIALDLARDEYQRALDSAAKDLRTALTRFEADGSADPWLGFDHVAGKTRAYREAIENVERLYNILGTNEDGKEARP